MKNLFFLLINSIFLFNRGQRRIEEFEDRLQEEEAKKEEARKKMEYTNKLLVKVKSDIEHLANKLHSLKAVSVLKFNVNFFRFASFIYCFN